jgi:uncharacterized protein
MGGFFVSRLPFWLKVGMYYLVAYVLTGIFFLLQAKAGISEQFIQLAQVGPALAAIILIIFEGGSVKSFFRKGFRFVLDRFTIAAILATVATIALISILTTSLWGIENFNSSNISIMSIFFIFSTVIAAMCEEIGWRGYLLSKLQLRISPLKSSIIIGILWAFWHVPKLLMGIKFFAVWFFAIMSFSFILTYVFNRTRGNIVVVTLVHSVVNLMASFCLLGMITDLRANILNSIVYTLWAAFLIRYGKRYYSRSGEKTSLSSF